MWSNRDRGPDTGTANLTAATVESLAQEATNRALEIMESRSVAAAAATAVSDPGSTDHYLPQGTEVGMAATTNGQEIDLSRIITETLRTKKISHLSEKQRRGPGRGLSRGLGRGKGGRGYDRGNSNNTNAPVTAVG